MAMIDLELAAADIVGHTVQLLLDFNKKGANLGNQLPPSIYMVPSVFRDLRPNSFNPRVVSIGPLHRKHKNLQGFEGKKATYLHDLLGLLDSPPEQTLKYCVEKVNGSIERIKACYVESKTYNDVELTEMMVIDGCFILDFIHHLSKYDGALRENMLATQSIIYDLLLIENQIPFFVLEYIFECTILKFQPKTSLINHLKVLLKYYNIFGAKLVTGNVSVDTTIYHILGLVHKGYMPVNDIPSGFKSLPKAHSAVELDKAGVQFKPNNEDTNWAMAMKMELPTFSCFPWFWGKPTLKMPMMCIDDFTDLILRNLIIYEQSFGVQKYVTAYACAMDMLIDTPEDVALLVKSEVIVNRLGSNEEAANMINSICKEVPIIDFLYYQQWQQLDTYCKGNWSKFTAWLSRKYFNRPLNITSLLAGIVVFFLTVIQTIFTIKATNSMTPINQ